MIIARRSALAILLIGTVACAPTPPPDAPAALSLAEGRDPLPSSIGEAEERLYWLLPEPDRTRLGTMSEEELRLLNGPTTGMTLRNRWRLHADHELTRAFAREGFADAESVSYELLRRVRDRVRLEAEHPDIPPTIDAALERLEAELDPFRAKELVAIPESELTARTHHGLGRALRGRFLQTLDTPLSRDFRRHGVVLRDDMSAALVIFLHRRLSGRPEAREQVFETYRAARCAMPPDTVLDSIVRDAAARFAPLLSLLREDGRSAAVVDCRGVWPADGAHEVQETRRSLYREAWWDAGLRCGSGPEPRLFHAEDGGVTVLYRGGGPDPSLCFKGLVRTDAVLGPELPALDLAVPGRDGLPTCVYSPKSELGWRSFCCAEVDAIPGYPSE